MSLFRMSLMDSPNHTISKRIFFLILACGLVALSSMSYAQKAEAGEQYVA